jgi:hydroxymethylpyrimidine pyrophosphatase-like HAD family hydrolase
MANEENLIPFTSDQSREEAKENGRKGGIASGKARRERKAFRETLETLLSMNMENGEGVAIDDIASFKGIKGQNISVQEAILIAQVQKAMKGDTKAAEYVRDSIGQKPTDKIEADFIVPVFGGEDALEE